MHLSIEEILKATNGWLLSDNNESNLKCKINSISINSKEVEKNALFVPLHGERVDSHKFINDALTNGAVATLTDEEASDFLPCKIYIKVKSTINALQDLAKFYRNKFHIPIVGITGSVGKTSTKEMVALALSEKFNVHKTKGNLNSQVGIPMTLFDLQEDNDVSVIEMGISEFSEMDKLADIVRPTFAVLTNIGVTHIENLKTQKNIMDEKLKITKNFGGDSVLFINKDDKMLSKIKNDKNYKIITFGLKSDSDFKAENITFGNNETRFKLINKTDREESQTMITIPSIGWHNVYSALAGLAVGQYLGVAIKDMQKAFLKYAPLAKRQCLLENVQIKKSDKKTISISIIDDTYNANPDSMINAIDVLNMYKKEKKTRSIAVLADMLELGEASKQLHFALGEHVAKTNVDILVTVGQEAKSIADEIKKHNKNVITQSFANNVDAFHFLKDNLKSGDTVLFKGSRGMHIDEIIEKLLNR